MASWFVSTTRTVGAGSRKEVEWLLEECPTEQTAKKFASNALINGLRVEAGTLPGIEPKVRVEWRAARRWAQSSNENARIRLIASNPFEPIRTRGSGPIGRAPDRPPVSQRRPYH